MSETARERADAQAELSRLLRLLHADAGVPTTREVARLVGLTGVSISHVTVHSMLSGNNVPHWDNLTAVVRALDGDPESFRTLHAAARAPSARITPALHADLTGGQGREFQVASGLGGDRKYQVAELTADAGLVTVLGGLERWQAYAIVAILHPPFFEE